MDAAGKLSSTLNSRYSPDELRYLPLNTALYEPPLDPELPALDSDGDSDDAEDGRGDEKRRSKGTSVSAFVFAAVAPFTVHCRQLLSREHVGLCPTFFLKWAVAHNAQRGFVEKRSLLCALM